MIALLTFILVVITVALGITMVALQVVWKQDNSYERLPIPTQSVAQRANGHEESDDTKAELHALMEDLKESSHRDFSEVLERLNDLPEVNPCRCDDVTDQLRSIESLVSNPLVQGMECRDTHMDPVKMTEYLREVIDVFSQHDVDYYAAYGTTLGFVRDGDYIEWDHDVDLCIRASDYIVMRDRVMPELFRRGYELLQVRPERICGFLFQEQSEHDVHAPKRYLFQKQGQLFDVFMQIWMPPTVALTVPSRSITVQVPKDPRVYLEDIYGPTWDVPNPKDKSVCNRYKPGETRLACAKPWLGDLYHRHITESERV